MIGDVFVSCGYVHRLSVKAYPRNWQQVVSVQRDGGLELKADLKHEGILNKK